MRFFGMNYDTGFVSAGSTTHEPFDADVVRSDLRVIRDELRCDAVPRHRRRAGPAGADRAAGGRGGVGGVVLPSPAAWTATAFMAFLLDGAERAERLRRDGARSSISPVPRSPCSPTASCPVVT
ncbi:hypothetical protein V2I01_43295 [Micromonospora sp. BRA006-A]|nr:hypothetical protein [Micromonospora sp. BRA006-A]